jgi:L-2-hydroxyglutarate oxidase LhgO
LHRYAEEITNALVRGLEKNGGEVRLKTHVVGLCKLNPAGP